MLEKYLISWSDTCGLSATGDWRNQAHETLDSWTLRIPEPKDDPDGKKTRKIIENHGYEHIAASFLKQ